MHAYWLTNALKRFTSLRGLATILLMFGFVLPAYPQGVTGPRQTGVIQDLVGNGPGELVISGALYNYNNEVTEFTLKGELIEDSDLAVGMVVRFTMSDGILFRVEVLGPNNLIEEIAEQGILD